LNYIHGVEEEEINVSSSSKSLSIAPVPVKTLAYVVVGTTVLLLGKFTILTIQSQFLMCTVFGKLHYFTNDNRSFAAIHANNVPTINLPNTWENHCHVFHINILKVNFHCICLSHSNTQLISLSIK
jgi:hypothetical protein